MGYDPSGPFITSILELKLDTTTLFEWQRHSQSQTKVPHYLDLLTFIDLRAPASEGSATSAFKKSKSESVSVKKSPASAWKPVTSYTSSHESVCQCILCSNVTGPMKRALNAGVIEINLST